MAQGEGVGIELDAAPYKNSLVWNGRRNMRILKCVIVLLIAAAPVSAQTPTPNPATLFDDCTRILSPDRPLATGPDAPTIRIVSPVSGTTIRSSEEIFAPVQFSVETTHFDLPGTAEDEAQRHWHLWLNNGVWGMYYQNEVLGHIPYGTWRVCAVMADAEHVDLGMPDAILLIVERAESGETVVIPPSAQSNFSPVSIVAGIGVAAAALGIGYWLGVRRRGFPACPAERLAGRSPAAQIQTP
jgi:hypothetical protein